MNQKLLFFKLLEDIAYYSMNLVNSFQPCITIICTHENNFNDVFTRRSVTSQ